MNAGIGVSRTLAKMTAVMKTTTETATIAVASRQLARLAGVVAMKAPGLPWGDVRSNCKELPCP